MSKIDDINKAAKQRQGFIDESIGALEKLLKELQLILFAVLEKEIGKMNIAKGKILNDRENRQLLAELETVITDFNNEKGLQAVMQMAKDFGKVKNMAISQFELQGILKQRLAALKPKLAYIDKMIERNLNILSKSETVKLEIMQYVQRGVLEGRPRGEFLKGLEQIIKGTPEAEGKLLRYYRGYGYDMYTNVENIYADETAKLLGMNYADYFGDIMERSRQFCIERAGKIFSREEMEQWKCDPDLPKMKGIERCDDSYHYIERGRWNCRHTLLWISDEIAEEERGKVE